MIKFNAKQIQTFRLKDFSGGVNTDSEGSLKELLQSLNFIIDSKGHPKTRGGSHVLNPMAPIGKQDIEVWGYLFGYEGEAPTFGSDFVTGKTLSASSALVANPAIYANDGDLESYWKMQPDKLAGGTVTVSSEATGYHAAHVVDLDDGTSWKAVI
jgi:hypothetical protein